jgi:UDP-N-acetylglucosamine 2-epimerase (non-hydrolysing)
MMYSVILGTRPEAIKLAPVILELQARDRAVNIVLTGQHKMAREMLAEFKIRVNFENRELSGDLNESIGSTLIYLNAVLDVLCPEYVIVQGDTYSAMAGALAASNRQIKVAHVEAGLRTNNKFSPFPEENYRRIISAVADYHFAPTEADAMNLQREGFSGVFNVGNTVIDALRIAEVPPVILDRKTALLTLHRRENRGDHFFETVKSVIRWLNQTDMQVVWPVHPNNADHSHLTHPRLIKTGPMSYREFTGNLKGCEFVITDSGGVQEEAAYLGKPVIVLRDTTERPGGTLVEPSGLIHAIENGAVTSLKSSKLYGDGHTSAKIVDLLKEFIHA